MNWDRASAAARVAHRLSLAACLAGAAVHAQDAAPVPDAQIESLIQRMTVEEKAGQLSLFAPAGAAVAANPETPSQSQDRQLDEIRAGRVTGIFNGADAAQRRRAQQVAVRESRLGIPLLFGADVIHGFRTIFPVPLAEAASWEPELAERTARAAAQEAAAEGLHWTFAPMVDIARDARWGRGVEGAGEDVLLAARFAAARVRGFQGRDLAGADSLLATPKHFAAYGAAEGGLDYNGAELSQRTLREVYLPPFKAALDAGALAVMASFNEIAGIPSTANEALLTGMLRDEWRFGGFVLSDYRGDADLVAHGLAADDRGAAKLAFLAGTDMSLQSGLYMRHLPSLVNDGEVSMQRLDEAVRRVLTVKKQLGLFERPFRGLAEDPGAPRVDLAAHRALARDAARRSIVMLKNRGALLPLNPRRTRIALIGPFASGPADLLGPWALFARDVHPVGLAEGLKGAMSHPARVSVTPGSGVEAPLPGGIRAAVAAARAADVVLLALGESDAMSGESRSRTSITIPRAQQRLAETVAATGKPVVVLLRNGRALALEGAVRNAQAILVTWFLGEQTGHAVADVVFGAYSPSGRLPVSFPQAPGQVPYYYSHKPTGRPAAAGDSTSYYSTHYLGLSQDALYPFGHGIGFGQVRYETLVLSRDTLPWNGELQVRATVRNLGSRALEEVVQLYIHDRFASVTRPVRELKAFRKIRLDAGAVAEVDFAITRADLQFIGRSLKPTVEPGSFDLWVGPSAAEGLMTRFELMPE